MREDAKALSSLTVIRDDTCFITLRDPGKLRERSLGKAGREEASANLQVNKVLAARLKESCYTNWFVDVRVVRPHVSGQLRAAAPNFSPPLIPAATKTNQEEVL